VIPHLLSSGGLVLRLGQGKLHSLMLMLAEDDVSRRCIRSNGSPAPVAGASALL